VSDPNCRSVSVRVVTGEDAAALDAAAIAAGTSSQTLMQTAGNAAAEVMLARLGGDLSGGVLVLTGPGNNGGDGWIVAGYLAERGIPVRVQEVAESRSADAVAARTANVKRVSLGAGDASNGVIVDALLGTGSRGAPTGALADAVQQINQRRTAGALVVALDMPTGVDATLGAGSPAVMADLTITFGALKRGHLLSRGHCGAIVAVDMGLGRHADGLDKAPRLVSEQWVADFVPVIEADTHKGRRRRVLIVGGARGMAGAVILATRAATRSGVGLVRAMVEEPSLLAVQIAAVEATATTWAFDSDDLSGIVEDCHAVLVGPGLGRSREAKRLIEALLEAWQGPTVLDADAINLFEGQVSRLSELLAGRPALLTPHVREFARLTGVDDEAVIRNRFDIAQETAHALGASILLKGVPTVITAPTGESMVSASGTPVLATAGSGDVLGGIAVTLLAQAGDPFKSGAAAAWIHGRAGEIANTGRPVRGVTLSDVLDAMSHAWRLSNASPAAPVMAELSAVAEGRTRDGPGTDPGPSPFGETE
jgi:ADP-dependent NAD(P)H-hydrate dehydratase / NAD(P)H-hydrate epimerase